MMRRKYSLEISERIRKEKRMDPEQFAIALGMTVPTYRTAIRRGYLTRRQCEAMCLRFKIPLKDFELIDGNKKGEQT